jgi:RNA polymerase sigma-70 factor (ECF subfamily)
MMHEYSGWLTEANIPMAQGRDREMDREFEARLAESSTLAFRVAYGVLRQREDAEDVAQEAFAKAYRSFRTLRERDRFRSWLVRITWRLAINRYRSNKRRRMREQAPAGIQFPLTAADSVALNERNACLWKAIDALPEKLRIVTVLAGIEEHDLREVALLLGIPEGTVKSRLFLARQRLKELLQ